MNDLKKIAKFYVVWKHLKKIGKENKLGKLTTFFDKSSTFDEGLEEILEKYDLNSNQMSFIKNNNIFLEKIEDETLKIYKNWKHNEIKGITFDNFNKYKALNRIEKSHWFFIKGDEKILNCDIDNFVSVVGSRKTPPFYKKWIFKYVPKNKIIVSGLATGADTMGHLEAIKNNQKIVVFPGTDIFFKPKLGDKSKIWEYAEKRGVIISSVFSNSKSFDKLIFLKRNKWMAQMVKETYSVYFKNFSGTLRHLLEVVKHEGNVYMPKDVFNGNKKFLRENKNLEKLILKVRIK